MLSKRLWLKNRSSTILVELPDFPGFNQSAVKLLQKSSVARSHSQANLGNLVRGKEKVSKRKQEICRYFVPTFVYIFILYFHNLPSLGKGYCIALHCHCNCIALHCLVKLYCIGIPLYCFALYFIASISSVFFNTV